MEHPEQDQLKAYLHQDETKTESREAIHAHVSHCSQCQAEVDRLTNEQSPATVTLANPPAKAQRIGRFEIIEKLGAGGMGTVYKARDPNLNRVVALKVLNSIKAKQNPTLIDRFKKEAEIGARFKDKNFVEVFESGAIVEGEYTSYFIVMELVAGKTLQEKMPDLPRGAKRVRYAAKLVEKLAEAMHRFHQRHYVHRDLKPANIFVLYEGGGIKIADFGIAATENERGLTSSGKCVGTPRYMSPEQINASPTFGRETDIYALGIIFYELLVGKPPFTGDQGELFSRITTTLPDPPSAVNSLVPERLDEICMKCLEKNPKARYTDGLTLAQDLHKFLNPPASPAWTNKTRIAVGVLTLALVLCVIGTPFGALAWFNGGGPHQAVLAEQKQSAEPNAQGKPAPKADPVTEPDGPPAKSPAGVEPAPMKQAVEPDPPEVIAPKPKLPDVFKFPRTPWDTAPPPMASVTRRKELVGHTGRIGCVVFSAKGTILVTGSDDKTVRIWSFPKGEELNVLRGQTGPIFSVAICPEEKLVAASPSGFGYDKIVKVWRRTTGEELPGLQVKDARSPWEVNALAFSRGGEKLLLGTDLRVILWNRTSGQQQTLETFPTTGDYAYAVAFSPRGDIFAAGLHFHRQAAGIDNVKTWTLEPNAAPQHDLVKDADWQHDSRGAMVYSPDGSKLAQVVPGKSFPSPQPGKAYIWSLAKTPRAEAHEVPAGGMYAAVITAKGVTRVAAANAAPRRAGFGTTGIKASSPAHHVRLWDSVTRQAWTLDTGHTGAVTYLAFSPDGDTLATASDDATVWLWDLATLKKRGE